MKYGPFRRAIITGGSSGIGLAAASLLAEQGCSLVLAGRSTKRLEEASEYLMQLHGPSTDITTLAVDISSREQVDRVLGSEAQHRNIDLLICSAGMVIPASFEDSTHEDFDRTMEVNLFGTWNVLKAVMPYVSEGGAAVLVSSLAGLIGTYGYSTYGASKSALVGMGEVLRNEFSLKRIHVSVLCPPDTDTPQLQEEQKQRPEVTRALSGNARVLAPEQVAAAMLRGIKRKQFLIIPGLQGSALFLLKRMMPALVFRIMDRTAAGILQKERSRI